MGTDSSCVSAEDAMFGTDLASSDAFQAILRIPAMKKQSGSPVREICDKREGSS